MSNFIRKAEDALTGNHHNTTSSTNHGPHSSNLANKLDPRVDSDLDNRGTRASNLGGYGAETMGTHDRTTVPHTSGVANTLDPRADSTTMGNQAHYGHTGTTGGLNTSSTTTAGPHSSNIANKLDPRVDSDMDNRARHNAMPGSSYGNPQSGATAGPHSSNIANKLDPRVDSDMDNRNAGFQRSL